MFIGSDVVLALSFFFFFFFSSRRRHTRFDCDWSSDVCSSDLNCRLRIARVSRVRRQAGRLAATFPRAHGEALREAWNKKCGVLGAAGRAAQRQDADLYPGASKPGSRDGELAGVPR